MKKAYYVNSIFEKLNIAGGLKVLSTVLVFSFCFLGTSSVSAQVGVAAPEVDQSFLRGLDLTKDKGEAISILKEQHKIIYDTQAADELEEVKLSARSYFLENLKYNIANGDDGVMGALLESNTNLHVYMMKFNDGLANLVDLEGIVLEYSNLLK